VEVGFAAFDPNSDYNDIKDIIDVKPEEKKDWYWKVVVGAAFLLLVTMLILYFLKKKKKPPTTEKVLINAYKAAMHQLEQLQKENPPAKIFYTRLVEVFREYVFHKKGILSMQRTTDDLILQLRSLYIPTTDFEKLSQLLRLSDYVKFARYEPAGETKLESLNTMKQSIQVIQNLDSSDQGHNLSKNETGGK